MTEFEDLPFDKRPDLSPYISHMTKSLDNYSAFDNLVNILKEGKIWASDKTRGFIKGQNEATCFMDVPLSSLKYILNTENSDPNNPRYEPFGIMITKKTAYNKGCKPVLYLSNYECRKLKIPRGELWRVVRLDVDGDKWINWMHEREWRCKYDFKLLKEPIAVLVKNSTDVKRLREKIEDNPRDFKANPKNILPLTVICEGLPYLK